MSFGKCRSVELDLNLNYQARLTRYLISSGVFSEEPFVVVDVGSRGGVMSHLRQLWPCVKIICFEPDEDECRRLNKESLYGEIHYPYALAEGEIERIFYVTKFPPSSGLYHPGTFMQRLANGGNAEVVEEIKIKTTTLDTVLKREGISGVDFIKLDAEGAELDILKGSQEALSSFGVFGVLSEVRFNDKLNGSPPFSAIDAFLQEQGFTLYDLEIYRQSRKTCPFPSLYDYHYESGEKFHAATINGQVMDGNALFFRDLVESKSADTVSILKLACLLELHSLNDCAAELLLQYTGLIEEKFQVKHLLDCVTPRLKNEIFPYDEYMEHFSRADHYFRPGRGKRYPEYYTYVYEGVPPPVWKNKKVDAVLARLKNEGVNNVGVFGVWDGGIKLAKYCEKRELRVNVFLDNAIEKRDKIVLGKRVVSPEFAVDKFADDLDCIFITSPTAFSQMENQLRTAGFDAFIENLWVE
jgi:FkbM family methyltransferase